MQIKAEFSLGMFWSNLDPADNIINIFTLLIRSELGFDNFGKLLRFKENILELELFMTAKSHYLDFMLKF